MFSTPLICCSSGVATVLETVSADAPGYVVVIWTVGGTISGYCATGRMASAPSPINVTKTLRTVAKIGGSLKLCERRTAELLFQDCFSLGLAVAVGGGVIADRAVLGRDLGARDGAHQTIDDDAVARLQAGFDDAQSAAKFADLHDLGRYGAVPTNRHDQML